ncbi:MAG: ABC transporter substrate-binding protein [Candidatus Thermoplasmatota archaeon]|jgi:ABC-type transport system substrate-binding protein|nr:ABC transporter substrate-binding protein [Candidatus Thermoplasmatota archaeon]MCL5789279.1 ABC transporter substrate-binding protein [Candidatus Thermoplasmatota archaeon]
MTQPQTPEQTPSQPKKSSAWKWIVVVVVIVVIIAGVVAVTYHPSKTTTTTKQNLSVTPITSGVATAAGTPTTFSPNIPSNFTWTKLVWNFGDGSTVTLTNGSGQVSHIYANPGSYLVSMYAVGPSGVASSNKSLLSITANAPISPNPAAIFGPIYVQGTSANGNTTISTGGWVNLTYAGLLAGIPVTVGSPVSGAPGYVVQSFSWNVDNGTRIIADNNTGMAETVNLTFSTPGLHTVALTTTTLGHGLTVTGTYVMTVAVGNYSVAKPSTGISTNHNVIINAEYVPGGPRTLDPAIAYDTVSYEVLYEIYQPLVYYNGTSLTNFHPVIATNVPSVANGEITTWNWFGTGSTAENITFYVNSSVKFSNGDPATAYDVYVSFLRTLLFANDAGTPGWIVAQSMLPAPTIYGPFNNSFYWIHHAITWNNTTNSVTFHLLPSVLTYLPNTNATYAGQNYGVLNQTFLNASLNQTQNYKIWNYGSAGIFFQLLAGPTASDIMDYSWLVAHNNSAPQPTLPQNTSASYANFEQYGTAAEFNSFLIYNTMGTGPYQLSLYEAAALVSLTVNPYYVQTSSQMPAPSALVPKVELEYLTNQGTAQEQLQSGYAQFAAGAYPPSSTPQAKALESQGIITAVTANEMSNFFFTYNLAINVTGAKSYLSSTNIWPGFFDNLSIRKAFSYAFNYSYMINVTEYNDGQYFANAEVGMLPPGIADYPSNITQLPGANEYNLKMAEFYFNQSGYGNGTWTFPAFNSQGQPAQDQMLTVWEAALSQISGGKIKMSTVDIPFAYTVAYSTVPSGANIMPLWFLGWIDDYPGPSDFMAPELQQYGIYTLPNGLIEANSTAYGSTPFTMTKYPDQWNEIKQMWNDIALAEESTNSSQATLYYYLANKIAVNLYLYVGVFQPIGVAYVSTSINPAGLVPSENTAVGLSFLLYYPLTYK